MKKMTMILGCLVMSSVALAAETEVKNLSLAFGCSVNPSSSASLDSLSGDAELGMGLKIASYDAKTTSTKQNIGTVQFAVADDIVVVLDTKTNVQVNLGRIRGLSQLCQQYPNGLDESYIRTAMPGMKFEAEARVTKEITTVGKCERSESRLERAFNAAAGQRSQYNYNYKVSSTYKISDTAGNVVSIQRKDAVQIQPSKDVALVQNGVVLGVDSSGNNDDVGLQNCQNDRARTLTEVANLNSQE